MTAWLRGFRPHLLVPGAVTAYLANEAGGYFPGTVALVAVVLALAILLRITVAREPLAGWSRAAAVVAGAGAVLASWTLASALWSDAPARAILEFDRTLLLLAAFVFAASFPRRPGDLSTLLRWVLLAMVATAVVGLATRLYPDVFVAVAGRQPSRLAHPLTYWNAMSLFCALGAVLAVHVASGRREGAALRIAAGAALPVLAVAGYFPFSRGGIAAALMGLAAYVVIARPRRLLFTVLTAGPAVAVALAGAYGAEALATNEYASPPGPEQGHDLALLIAAAAGGAALARLALLPLEQRLDLVRIWLPEAARRMVPFAAAAAVIAVAAAAVTLGAPERVRDQYRAFVSGNVVQESTDTRQRLTAGGNNGRVDIWGVGWRAFTAAPLLGSGAGTFQLDWERERPTPLRRVDGHSLYVETLGELGLVGLMLLATMLGGIVVALVRLLSDAERHAAAAVLAAGTALLVHAGIDWDWELPSLFVWLFMAGAVACARPADARPHRPPARLPRLLGGLVCLAVAVTPLLVTMSESRLNTAERAFARGDCGAAVDTALASTEALPVRPEPFELVGYCDLRAGRPDLAVAAMEAARRRDPHAWQYAYGLAVALALDGRDPRAAIAEAHRLNPLEPRAAELARALRGDQPARWRRAAARAKLPF